MSVVSLYVEPRRALVAVDTLGHRQGARPFACSKLMPLPHASCVLAGRGAYRSFLGVTHRYLAAGAAFLDSDIITDTAPGMIAAVADDFPEDVVHALELFAVGYSAKAGRLAAAIWKTDGTGAIVQTETLGTQPGEVATTFAPWEDPQPPPVAPDSPEHCLRLARMQVAAWRSLRALPVGGQLLCAELTRTGQHTSITTSCLGDLG